MYILVSNVKIFIVDGDILSGYSLHDMFLPKFLYMGKA